MKIIELNKEQINKIVKALEDDGFSNIQVNEHYISFSKFPRDYEMYGLNLNSNFNNMDDDNGINIIFQEEAFFNPKKNDFYSKGHLEYVMKQKELNSNYVDMNQQIKSRLSTSLNNQSEASDFDTANDIPGWKNEGSYNLKDLNKYYTEFQSTTLVHIKIKNKDHFILDNGKDNSYVVYEGHPSILTSILMEHPDNFFEAPTLRRVVNEIKLESNEF